jgi:hypothetical protein
MGRSMESVHSYVLRRVVLILSYISVFPMLNTYSVIFIGRIFEGIAMTMGWQEARMNGARGCRWGNISFWMLVALGRKGIFRLVALMNVLCFVFVYRFEGPGDINVTFYGVIFRESTHQESHLILFAEQQQSPSASP